MILTPVRRALLVAAAACAAVAAGAADRPLPQPAPCKTAPFATAPFNAAPWTTATAGAADAPPPPQHDRGYDVTSYDLDLAIVPSARSIEGTNAVGLRALAAGLDTVVLDLTANLVCDGVTRRAGTVTFLRDGDRLRLHLDPPAATAAPETLTVAWHGRPEPHGDFNAGLMYRVYDPGTPDDPTDGRPIVANVSQPWSSHSWWPCKDVPGDKALVSLAVTVPDGLRAVSNGALLGQDSPGPGLARFRWREAYPLPPYLVGLAISDYESWYETCEPAGGPVVPLEFHVFPVDRERAEHDLAPTCDMLHFMTSLAGPYPFAGEKYGQVEIKWFGAMEHQTASSISQLMLTGDGRFETVVIHELAHHWYGDNLTPARWEDIWLNEGFARYCEALWLEHSRGAEAYRAFMRETGPLRHPDLFAGEGVLADPDPILPNLLVYDKGAYVLHMLRGVVGDAAFFAFLRDYATDPAVQHGLVDTPAMIAAAERAAGRSLDAFFTPWLTTDTTPVVSARPAPPRLGDPQGSARVRIEQHQAPVFVLPLELEVSAAAGVTRHDVVLEQALQEVLLPAGGPARTVTVDPDSLALLRHWTAPPPVLTVAGPRPQPVGASGGALDIYITENLQVTVKTYDTRGLLMAEEDLGVLPAGGPAEDEGSSPHTWTWRPQGPAGAPLPSGIYWLEITAGRHRAVRKAVHLH